MRHCIDCKKLFVPTHRHRKRQKFCSRVCYFRNSDGKERVKNRDIRGAKNPFWGKTPTVEHRKKISNALIGRKLSAGNTGKKLSKEWIEKIRNSLSGEKCYAWKGGGDCYWRKTIPKRDNYTCQHCGIKDKRVLQVDHIKSRSIYPALEYEPSNMTTLCANCHKIKTIEDEELKKFIINKKRNGK